MTAPIRLRGFPAPRRLELRWLVERRGTQTVIVDTPVRPKPPDQGVGSDDWPDFTLLFDNKLV